MSTEGRAQKMLVRIIAILFLACACQTPGQAPPDRSPVIDMHLHAHSLSQYGGGMPNCGNDQEILYPGADPRERITLAHR
jgi:hypothetical protein